MDDQNTDVTTTHCPVANAGQCGGCPHEQFIQNLIAKEQRELCKEQRLEEIWQGVKVNVVTWAVIGSVSYVLLVFWEHFKQVAKQ